MISNEIIRIALIEKANSSPLITASLPSGTILEYNWQGTDSNYPNARLHIESQFDVSEITVSCPSIVEFSWYIFSEQGTSKQADQIAGKFVTDFRGLSFSQNNVKFASVKILETIPAMRQDERTWRAQVRCRSIIHAI